MKANITVEVKAHGGVFFEFVVVAYNHRGRYVSLRGNTRGIPTTIEKEAKAEAREVASEYRSQGYRVTLKNA